MSNFLRLFLICLLPFIVACGKKATVTATATSPGYIDAVEFKLKARELADQMLATMPNDALQGYVAMPTAFVDQNNTKQSSAMGRLLAESLFYEFNQRGFPAREYRLTGNISVQGGHNDIALAADQLVSTVGQKWAALVVGTYHVDKDATFVNARLVRASDGLVLRTGQLVLVNSPIVSRLATPSASPITRAVAAKGSTSSSKRYSNAGQLPPSTLYTPASTISSGSLIIRQGK